ncbi:AAA domain-containing protein [Solibacillus sp. FSL H8-0538]|uniref:AAA domain-containing protein n=1 Tax=Solibacillus sp. FSL H8-0538 TaxID=2921400 RepID=UPI0030F95919
MTPKIAAVEQVRCHIVLTNTAREAIKQHVQDEHAFFNLQKNFLVYVEKLSVETTQLNLTLFFDNEKNIKLNQKFQDRVVIMDCVFDLKTGLLAKSFRTRGKGTPVATNRRAALQIQFVPTRISGHTYQEKFIQTLAALPVAQERFDYVNKRISSWEGYLKVLDKNAAIEDIKANFTSVQFNADFTHMTLNCSGIDQKQWKQLKGLSTRIQGFKQEVGEVVKVNRGQHSAQIELKPAIAKLARKNELNFQSETVEFTNASTKSQLKRLLKGFERLKEGLAANANLENILFEDKPVIAERRKDVELEFHNNLNEFQRDAVIGAMSAEDLYVIQGPPGTGKTTVISEICYQNAKAGLKTLVASQSNLAVDNALSRLLSNKDIRILRYGRTESIEEEGKKFIEENVAAYWKEQTYEAITAEISAHEQKEATLNSEITICQEAIEVLKEEQLKLLLAIEQKEAAKAELHVLADQITTLKKQLATCKKVREETEVILEKLTITKETLTSVVDALTNQLATFDSVKTMAEKLPQLTSQMTDMTKELELAKKQHELQQLMHRLQQVEQQQATMQMSSNHDAIIEKIGELKKVHQIEQFMHTHQIRRSYVMDRLLTALERIHPQMETYKPLKEIRARLDKAIIYSETTLGIHVETPNLPMNHSYSLNEVNEFLTKLSHAFATKRVNATNGTRSIQGLHLRKQYLDQVQEKYMEYIRETLIIFDKLKEEIIEQFKQQNGTQQAVLQQLTNEQMTIQQRIQEAQAFIQTLNITTARPVEQLQALRLQLDTDLKQLEHNQVSREQVQQQYDSKLTELTLLQEQIINGELLLEEKNDEFKQVNATGLALEKKREQLELLTKQNPELALEKTHEQIQQTTAEIAQFTQQITMLPVTQALQLEWQGLLQNANDHDLNEIRKLYVKHANVIGTTCVASANKEFMDNYPTFDVVIIDEVSKATPPELLLPMLKGAKIILVGDHHQLPPLVGDETFEETLEQVIKDSDTFEEKRELEKLLEESLFERLYKNLPHTNKKMLAIQYRMHENIMATIAPFYKNENEELQCGLTDSDEQRDHKLESKFISRKNHLLWLDMPSKQGYFEERMKEGSSLFNAAELDTIKSMLLDLNAATGKAKEDGLISQEALKSVGVISFYAEQVKRINRLIEQEIEVPHLHIRTGSVDKFQGMEMDVILVSMVRNNDNKHGDIGFAKDYRRLNVALSRARELLILIGSTDMFTKRPKQEQTRHMYKQLLEVVKAQNGYRDAPQAIV